MLRLIRKVMGFKKVKRSPMAVLHIDPKGVNSTFQLAQEFDRLSKTENEVKQAVASVSATASELRSKLNSELIQAHRKSAIISESLQDAILTVDFKGTIVSANKSAREIFGYDLDELVGLSIDSLLLGAFQVKNLTHEAHALVYSFDYGNKEESSYEQYLKYNGTTILDKTFTFKAKTKDGKEIDVEYKVNALNATEASSHLNVVFIVIIKDITEKLAAMNKIDELTQRQLGILSSVPNPIFYKDKDFKIVGCNRAFYSTFKTSYDQLVGKDFDSIFPLDAAKQFSKLEQFVVKLPRGEVAIKQFKLHLKAQEQEKVVVVYCTALWDFQGRFSGIVGAIVDLTQLISVERFKDTLLEAIPNPIYHLDKHLKYKGCNTRYLNLLGLASNEVIGKTRGDILSVLETKEEAQNLIAFLREQDSQLVHLRGEQTFEVEMFDFTKKQYRHYITYRTAVVDGSGKFSGILAVMTDITEIKSLQVLKQSLFDSMPNPVFYKNKDLKYAVVNSAYADIVGLNKADLLGETRESVIEKIAALNPVENTEVANHLSEISKALQNRDLEIVNGSNKGIQVFEEEMWSTKHQSFRNVVFYCKGLFSSAGEFDGIICSILDITEIKTVTAEAAARKSTHRNTGKHAS
jgi:PAS domain-containing protein